jgi:transcriptional regulator with XRE-family HTH domain
MQTTLQFMTLKELLERHGILAASELRRRIPTLSRAQAYNLWRGKAGVGKETMRLLHDRLGISYDELMEIDPVPSPRSRQQQKPLEGEGPKA